MRATVWQHHDGPSRVYMQVKADCHVCHIFKGNNRNIVAEIFAARKPNLSDFFKGLLAIR